MPFTIHVDAGSNRAEIFADESGLHSLIAMCQEALRGGVAELDDEEGAGSKVMVIREKNWKAR